MKPRPSIWQVIRLIRAQIAASKASGLLAVLGTVALFLGLSLAVPIVLLARLLCPVVLIRFGPIGHTGRIGNFAPDTELYLCDRALRRGGSRRLDIFYYENPPANQQLKKMADRKLHVFGFARCLDLANRGLPGGEKHLITSEIDTNQRHQLLAKTPVQLAFTDREERQGRLALQKWGVSPDSPFVCFMARDSAYLEARYPNDNWRHHEYRNSDIRNYIPAAEELVRRGYLAIRMGALVREPLATSHPAIFDYAAKARTDSLDIYLSAKCQFFLTSGTGIDSVTTIFRRPIACVNFVNLGFLHYSWGPNDLFIPKKFWLREEGRYLALPEIFDSGIAYIVRSEQFEQLGIELIENTSAEITAVAVEMDERLNGIFHTSAEDEDLQRRFWDLFDLDESDRMYLPRMGAEFLRQNPGLLQASSKPTMSRLMEQRDRILGPSRISGDPTVTIRLRSEHTHLTC